MKLLQEPVILSLELRNLSAYENIKRHKEKRVKDEPFRQGGDDNPEA